MYTLSDYKQIKKIGKRVLPQETLDIITKLSKMIGIDHQIPVFKQEKVYTISQQMTILLNKLTEDNYKSIEEKIIKLLESNPYEIEKSSAVIFDIITNNSFYGSIYASLYVSLVKKWSIFKDLFDIQLDKHRINLQNIKLLPSTDYDEFCKCNALNERYRTFSQFIVHMTIQGIVTNHDYNEFLTFLVDLLHTLNVSDNKSNMDEIVEHLYLCVMKSKSLSILISRSRLSMPGVSIKVLFRLMDILDVI